MNEPKRRFLESGAITPTFIGAGTVVVGQVRGAGAFVVAGTVEGDGDLGGSFSLAVSGIWQGNVRAAQAVIAGRIQGSLTVEGKLEIGVTAVIRGKVSARTIAIAKGAIVDGEIEVTSGDPVLQFEEKRQPA